MNRLVQGDVGSGKTVVAAGLCALAAQNGWQAAFMAPTEILAAQHAETLAPMLDKLGISCTLLTGSMTAAQKRAALAAIETGAAQVVVGTHALIQQGVQFHRLGAVIADEQHRFGVERERRLAACARHVGYADSAHARTHHVRRSGCVRAGRDPARKKSG